jgi:tetratricopeptide (TPR) repeat protein
METAVLVVYSFFYLCIRLLFGLEDTPTEKDAKKYAEGRRLIREKKYLAGYEYFSTALKEQPKSSLAWTCRAKCSLELGNIYAAIADCSKASFLDNNVPEAYMIKGQALWQLEGYPEAYKEFDKAVWYARDNAEAYRWRAILHQELGNRERALKDLKKAVSLGDEDANYILLKSSLLVKRYKD